MATEPIRTIDSSRQPWSVLARASDDAPVGLILISKDGNVLSANRSALGLLKVEPKAVFDRPVTALFDSDDKSIRKALVECIENGRAFNDRAIIRTRAGVTIDCDLALYPVKEDGEEGCHAMWINDVSDHVAMQRSLLQVDRLSALGEIVGGVAHELNNPLTGILGYTQLLMDDHPSEKNRQRLEHILTEAMRCEAIVQSLRGFSSHSGMEHAVHNVNQIVDHMVTLLEYQMRVDGIEVTRKYTDAPQEAFVDAHSLGRAVLNIVHNAHQALQLTEDRPRRFVVVTEGDDDEVRLRFRDNGPGIRPENLPRLFDPFFTTREFGRGIGLGLSVAYGVVRGLGGRIDVDSSPGNGAEFLIRLPRSGDAR